MAIRRYDELSQILGPLADERRNWNWLWSYVLWIRPSSLSADDFGSPHERQRLADVLKREIHLKEQIQLDASQQLLPLELFMWILDDKRQLKWITSQLSETEKASKIPAVLSERDRTLTLIDLCNLGSLASKRIFVENLRLNWNRHRDQDKRYEWFTKKPAKERLQFAWDWFTRNVPLLTYGETSFQSQADLLIFFDQIKPTPEQSELWLMKIKKQWSQHNYRAQMQGKSQLNVVLKDSTISQLDQLASKHDLSRSKVLERLIELETRLNSLPSTSGARWTPES